MEARWINGLCLPTADAKPSLCRTCIYNRFIGRDDEPRILGSVVFKPKSEEPCVKCSANPFYRLYYASRRRVRRLAGMGESSLLRLRNER
jgi:hypothetical protein